MDNNNFDFYAIGKRCANDRLVDLNKLAMEYGNTYGPEAKELFEAGIASVLPQYLVAFPKVQNDNLENISKNTRG